MAVGKLADGRNEVSTRPYIDDTKTIALVDFRWQHSQRHSYKTLTRLQSWYNTYRGVWAGRLAQFRNNVAVPFIFAMIQSDVAQKVQTSLGGWPIVTFDGYAPEDIERARVNEVLISAQMQDADSLVRGVDFFLQADIVGVGIARYGWKNITRPGKVRKRETIAPGLIVDVEYEKDLTHFDGPIWETIDRLDFGPQPGIKRIEDMAWVCHRYWRDYDDLVDDANGPYPYFDPQAIKRLGQYPMGTQSQMEYTSRQYVYRNQWDYLARQQEKYAKPVEIIEMHGSVPAEYAPDGIRDRCIAIANGRVVLKNIPSPFGDRKKPFLSYAPMPDPYGFDSPGKVEIAEKLQKTVDRIANQKLDALDMVIDPMWAMSSSVNINSQNLFTRAGRVILVDGAADDSNIRPLTPDMRGLEHAYPEIAQLWQFMQLGAGVNDIVMGFPGGDRETARGFLGRQENVMSRLGLEAKLAEAGFIEPLANAFRHLDKNFLTFPHELQMIGSVATTNPITGLPLAASRNSVDIDDLTPDYRARAVGSSRQMGRNVKQQNALQLLQMMSSNPALLQLVNWGNFARQLFDLFDMKNINELLVQAVPAVNQQADQMGMDPNQLAGNVTQQLPQLSPDILGHLMSQQGGLGAMAPETGR
jgi:hypothetical protein